MNRNYFFVENGERARLGRGEPHPHRSNRPLVAQAGSLLYRRLAVGKPYILQRFPNSTGAGSFLRVRFNDFE